MPTGLTLLHLLDAVYLVALGIWAGVTLFCGLGAPAALGPLETGDRAEAERLLLGRGLVWGAACGAIALPALVCGAMAVPELRGPIVGIKAALLLAALLLTLARAGGLWRRGAASGGRAVESLVAVIVIGLLAAHAYREPPTTRGIEEPSPMAIYQAHEAAARSQSTRFRANYPTRPAPSPAPPAAAP